MVVNLVILIAGLQSIRSLVVRQFPRSDMANVVVTTAYIGANADLVRGFITAPLERAILLAEGRAIASGDLRLGEVPTAGGQRDHAAVVKIPPTGIPLEDVERHALVEALKMSNWVQKDAAELLSISPRDLRSFMSVAQPASSVALSRLTWSKLFWCVSQPGPPPPSGDDSETSTNGTPRSTRRRASRHPWPNRLRP